MNRARWLIPAAVLLFAAGDAHADLSKKVIKAFKGQLIVSTDAVDAGGSDKEVIAAYKAAKLKELKGEANGDDVTSWTFHYTAFLKKRCGTNLTFEFFNEAGDYVANQSITGVDPSDPVIEGDISITEDDGPTKGKKYTLKLVGQVKGKEIVIAQTSLEMD
jgi:hypothetical protein